MSSIAPVKAINPLKRIHSIDILRGIAVLGILIMNIQSFSMINAAYINPMAYGSMEGVNKWVWIISHIIGNEKFMTLFSMLFGAGVVLLYERKLSQGKHPGRVHYFRNFWLLIFGLLHAFLLWYGDILVAYSLCGFFVFLFRKKKVRGLLIWAGVFFIVPVILNVLTAWSIQYWPEEQINQTLIGWKPDNEIVQKEVMGMQGNFAEQFQTRLPNTTMMLTFLLFWYTFWRATAAMLIGMALFKSGVLLANRSYGFYKRMIAIGMLIGLPLIVLGVYLNFLFEWKMEFSMFIGNQFNYVGSLALAFSYLGLVMLFCKTTNFAKIKNLFSATGKMAFTNYILTTIISGLIFYGHGLGLFGQTERIFQVLIMFGIWAIILIISPLWLKKFYFGPLEWLWRVLTYRNFIPFKRS